MVDVSGTNFNPWNAIGNNTAWNNSIYNWQGNQAQQLATWQAPQQQVFNDFGRQTDYYSALGASYGRGVGGDWSGYGSGVSLYGEPYVAPQAPDYSFSTPAYEHDYSYGQPSYSTQDYSYQYPQYDFSYLYNQPSYSQPTDLGPSYGYTPTYGDYNYTPQASSGYDIWTGGASPYANYGTTDLSSYYGGAGTYGSYNYDASPWYSGYYDQAAAQPAATDYSYQYPSYDFSYLYNQPAASTPSYDYSGWGRGATPYQDYGQQDLSSYYGGAGTYNSWNYDSSPWYSSPSTTYDYSAGSGWGNYDYSTPSYYSQPTDLGPSWGGYNYATPDYSSIWNLPQGTPDAQTYLQYDPNQFMQWSEPYQTYGRGADFTGTYDDITASGGSGYGSSNWYDQLAGYRGGPNVFDETTGTYGPAGSGYDTLRNDMNAQIAQQQSGSAWDPWGYGTSPYGTSAQNSAPFDYYGRSGDWGIGGFGMPGMTGEGGGYYGGRGVGNIGNATDEYGNPYLGGNAPVYPFGTPGNPQWGGDPAGGRAYFDEGTGRYGTFAEQQGMNIPVMAQGEDQPQYPAWANYNGTSYGGEPALDPLMLQRAPYAAQYMNNPDLAARLYTELRGDSEGRTGIVEAMLNRANSTGADPLNPDYYDYSLQAARDRFNRAGDDARAQVYADIARAFNGSNVSGLATDWASGGTADNSARYSTETWRSPAEGERFFRKDIPNDYAGRGTAAMNQAWYNALMNPEWLGGPISPWRNYGYPFDPSQGGAPP